MPVDDAKLFPSTAGSSCSTNHSHACLFVRLQRALFLNASKARFSSHWANLEEIILIVAKEETKARKAIPRPVGAAMIASLLVDQKMEPFRHTNTEATNPLILNSLLAISALSIVKSQ